MADPGEATAQAFVDQNSSAITIILVVSASLIGLALCCAVRKFCCDSRKGVRPGAVGGSGLKSKGSAAVMTVERFQQANPPRVNPPNEAETNRLEHVALDMIRHGHEAEEAAEEKVDPNSSKARYMATAARAARHEHALLFGLEDPHAETSFREKGIPGHRHKEQFLMHPVMTYQATRPLHAPKLGYNHAVYYEVTLDHLDTMMPECGIAIGWATSPYVFNHLPGLADFSLALHSYNGLVFASGFAKPYKYIHDKIRRGDTIGCGYERVREPRNCVEFFWTLNGRKMPAVPHLRMPYDDLSVSGRGDMADNARGADKMKYNTGWQRTPEAVALLRPDNPTPKGRGRGKRGDSGRLDIVPWEVKTNHMSHFGTTPDYLPCLGRGSAYPVVGCFGSAKVRLNFTGPYVYRPAAGKTVSTSFRSSPPGVGAGVGSPSAGDLMAALAGAEEEGWPDAKQSHDPTAAELLSSLRGM